MKPKARGVWSFSAAELAGGLRLPLCAAAPALEAHGTVCAADVGTVIAPVAGVVTLLPNPWHPGAPEGFSGNPGHCFSGGQGPALVESNKSTVSSIRWCAACVSVDSAADGAGNSTV